MLSRLLRATKGRSIGEIFKLIAKNIAYLVYKLTPRARRRRARDHAFDVKWGTDTAGMRDLGSLKINLDRARHGRRYQAGDGEHLLAILDDLGLSFPDYTFIDFGSGKGRVILMAALRPFRRVYGVEFSEELTSVALKNLHIFEQKVSTMSPVQVACVDAAEFKLPVGNLVVYFNNPFDATVMAEVVANLEAALRGGEREIRVIYVHPQCAEIFDRSGYWTRETVQGMLVLSTRSAA